MKVSFQKIETNMNYAFYVKHMHFQYFSHPIMFHPEIEILLVIQGTGTLFIGNSIVHFGPGDLVMIGSNIPHGWQSDEKYTRANSKLISEIKIILFKPEIFGEQFWQLPESKGILKIIKLSQRGIKLTGKTLEEVTSLIDSITTAIGFNRIILLLSILEKISKNNEYQTITILDIQNMIDVKDSNRLNKVYKYLMNNYQKNITLEEAASIANLSVPAFCRYFKKRVNKTFIQSLNEIRIAFACQLLIDEDHSVTNICYTCGFSNVSFFIKKFKKITGLTPLNYRKEYTD